MHRDHDQARGGPQSELLQRAFLVGDGERAARLRCEDMFEFIRSCAGLLGVEPCSDVFGYGCRWREAPSDGLAIEVPDLEAILIR